MTYLLFAADGSSAAIVMVDIYVQSLSEISEKTMVSCRSLFQVNIKLSISIHQYNTEHFRVNFDLNTNPL